MKLFSAEELRKITGGEWQGPVLSVSVNAFSYDSRLIQAGEVFLALKTEKQDGHAFLKDVFLKNALAAIVEHYDAAVELPQLVVSNVLKAFQDIALWYRHRYKGTVVGITGTVGKTSTREFLNGLFGHAKARKDRVNWNNILGVPVTLLGLDLEKTSPVVIEAGMSLPGEMAQMARVIEPDCTIITNIQAQHLNTLESVDKIAEEKVKLVYGMRRNGLVFLSNSAWAHAAFHPFKEQAYVIAELGETVKAISEDRVCRYQFTRNESGIYLEISSKRYNKLKFKLKPMIRGMVTNFVIAVIVAKELRMADAAIQDAFDAWEPVYLRGETRVHGEQSYYVDCYNCCAVALKDALENFVETMAKDQKKLYVIGGMPGAGDVHGEVHYGISQSMALKPEDRFVLVGKETKHIERGLLDRGHSAEHIQYFDKAAEAKELVGEFKGAIFLKGSRLYQLEQLLPDSQESTAGHH